jgi:hypothetical protein
VWTLTVEEEEGGRGTLAVEEGEEEGREEREEGGKGEEYKEVEREKKSHGEGNPQSRHSAAETLLSRGGACKGLMYADCGADRPVGRLDQWLMESAEPN